VLELEHGVDLFRSRNCSEISRASNMSRTESIREAALTGEESDSPDQSYYQKLWIDDGMKRAA